MPRYRIGRNYGYVGTSSEDEIEADSIKEAEEAAKDFAYERVDYWAELIEDEDNESN